MSTHSINRRILGLALPAFAALVAQPLFLLADTAIVARLGTEPLAGLGAGATVTSTLVGLMVFLAYGSTAVVARHLGAGHRARALELGAQAMWLAVGLGVVLGALTWFASPWLLTWLGTSGEVHAQALSYARWSLPGLPGMLLVLAATLGGLTLHLAQRAAREPGQKPPQAALTAAIQAATAPAIPFLLGCAFLTQPLALLAFWAAAYALFTAARSRLAGWVKAPQA